MSFVVACYHGGGPGLRRRIPDGSHVVGVVICVHAFGVGVWLIDEHQFGNVNIPHFYEIAVNPETCCPDVGVVLDLVTFGYTGSADQLRLGVVGVTKAPDTP